MSGELKPYPEMKDSGVDALGAVPAHWEVTKLGHIGRLFKGRGASKEDEAPTGIPCVRYGDLYTRHNYFIHDSRACIAEERASNYTPIEYGDVLFAASGETIDEIGKSAVNLIEGEAYCGGDVIIFRPRQRVDSRYMGYVTDFRPAAIQKARMGRGFTVIHIYGDELKRLAMPLPPVPEQAAIVRFLDHADRRIQRYIHAKEKLIALLEEQKRVVIHQAVTGRIDVRTGRPYPAYKPSGIEWLGEVPHHWNVKRLRQCGTMVGGMTPSMGEPRFWDGDIPWVTPKDMKHEAIRDSGVQVTKAALRETSIRLIGPPAVLMVVRGMILARKVPVAWITNCVTINQDMKAVVPAIGIKAEFLARALNSAQDALAILIDEAGHGTRRLPTERLRTLAIAIPSEDEQSLVVRFVDQTTTKIDKRIADTRREINLLHEYRTRLIADAVTGKLDVREAAVALPEEPDDPDAAIADFTGAEGGGDGRRDRGRGKAVLATQEEATP